MNIRACRCYVPRLTISNVQTLPAGDVRAWPRAQIDNIVFLLTTAQTGGAMEVVANPHFATPFPAFVPPSRARDSVAKCRARATPPDVARQGGADEPALPRATRGGYRTSAGYLDRARDPVAGD